MIHAYFKVERKHENSKRTEVETEKLLVKWVTLPDLAFHLDLWEGLNI